MGPAGAMTSGLPSATAWYMNPYFLISFGAVVALGFVIFAVAYFVFVKLKIGTKEESTKPDKEKCNSCGLTADAMRQISQCTFHEAMTIRTQTLEREIKEGREDLKELRRRVDAIERGSSK